MAAPASNQWGLTVGDYGKIGISASVSYPSATQATLTVEVWFWSKYSVSDSANTLYFDNLASSGSATTSKGAVSVVTSVASGDGWSTANQVKIATYTYTYTRTASAQRRYLFAKLADIDRVGGTMSATESVVISALPTYTVSYNANGGSGAPSAQTKTHGTTLKLSTTKPTRTGYTFKGWATSASGSVAYASGANYTANAAATLYAVWQANTYTVTYNANGGTGAPASQTKTHGVALHLSSTIPARQGYIFKGWAKSAAATAPDYAAGASYTANAAATLYAVWELGYSDPRIFNLTATRCTSAGAASDEGTFMRVAFDWELDGEMDFVVISWTSESGESGSYWADDYAEEQMNSGARSGTFSEIVPNQEFSTEHSYTITVAVGDSDFGIANEAVTTLPGAIFPIDALAGGKGVAFGKPAVLEGVADFAFDAKFNKPVYGKALGMDRLPAIPSNSDLNNYMETGCYAVQSNAIAETIANIPVKRAGRLEVWSSTGEGVRSEQWSYLRQRFVPYNDSNAVWERDISRSSDNVWRYYDWWRSSLTPDASVKVYDKAAMTISLRATTTLGAVNTYSKIPFNNVVLSTSGRLTLQEQSIRIGANIEYVKVSGQALVGCGNTDGLRHVKIRKVSGSTTTNVSWVTAYGISSRQTVYPLAPAIVSVKEGDLLQMVFYTSNSADSNSAGSSGNGWQTYLTVEEL